MKWIPTEVGTPKVSFVCRNENEKFDMYESGGVLASGTFEICGKPTKMVVIATYSEMRYYEENQIDAFWDEWSGTPFTADAWAPLPKPHLKEEWEVSGK